MEVKFHITQHRDGFPEGLTEVTNFDLNKNPTGIQLCVLKKQANQSFSEVTQSEKSFLLMYGEVEILINQEKKVNFKRNSLFNESSSCIHLPSDTSIEINFVQNSEFTTYAVSNQKPFPVEVYYPSHVINEHRGKGQVGDTCYRFVRTIFDDRNSHANANLVLGEVINMPGKWSSYPPHHHPQPEIYHYRFTLSQGYGHGELGDKVFKIKQYDTVKILNEWDHAQCSAPGYGMYYSWVIRHLENNRYTVPEFTAEHNWTQQENSSFWKSAEL